ncbi:MAG: pyruvate dehydrogenase (acetyl-transferring) E1 component subunit alpha [bacterium]|nr:pyruvate dehydrogenase (acetyl-transferring) E1 component subunit alpha [bacterium]
MLFKDFDPHDDKMLRIMDNDGKIVDRKNKPDIPDEKVLDSYKLMHLVRTADLMMVSYQRQGRMYTYPPNLGQEAVGVGVAPEMQEQDWVVPAFRELGMWLTKGGRLKDHFLFWGGFEDGAKFSDAPRILPISVPIASQLVHAVGIGYAVKYKKEDSVVFTVVGDGGTSEGITHEAFNFAAVWKAPIVFIIQNNQYAISVPLRTQTASKNLAIRAHGYGMPGIQVDGNDYFAVNKATAEAAAYARAGKGPVLIEALTYRMGAHTTSDDPTLYRTKEEENSWALKDPLKRLKGYLLSKGLWDDTKEKELEVVHKAKVEEEFTIYENYPPHQVEDAFKYMYSEMPENLKQQRKSYEEFIAWKEAQK